MLNPQLLVTNGYLLLYIQYTVGWGCFGTKYWSNSPNYQKYQEMTHSLLSSHLLISHQYFNRVVNTKMGITFEICSAGAGAANSSDLLLVAHLTRL